ncbi:MAG: serine/threonine-protein phosphatase [Phycisphaera sp.]|nr:MAG: serine/threonine-protein phosphatase [Phycisphaera sp.]
MSEHRVRLIGTDNGLASLKQRAKGLLTSWPDSNSQPRFDELTIDQTLLNDASSEIAIDDGSVLLVGVPKDTPSPAIYKTIDLLRAARISAILLLDDCTCDTGQSSGGVLTMCCETSDDVLAASVHALCSRQETINDLVRDLSISVRSSGGVREQMERISQELSLASTIQRELIPRELPKINGLEFGVLYRPAGFVSGDIYNVQQIDDRHVGFFIADAIGHGVPAALLTMIISRALNIRGGVVEGRLLSPSDALARLNDDLCDVSDGNPRFATAVYGILDSQTGLMRIANAGHPPPVRIAADKGENYDIEAGGPLLGVFHDAHFPEETIELAPGETLLLYSDGFELVFPNKAEAVENTTKKSNAMAYLDHLLHIGRWMDKGKKSLACAISDLEDKLDEACGSLHQADDVTALAISRQAVSSKAAA